MALVGALGALEKALERRDRGPRMVATGAQIPELAPGRAA